MEKREIDKVLLKKFYVGILAFIGFLTTIKLAVIYYESNFDPYALPSFCSINSFVDCDGVAQTIHSQFFGIPLAYWGMGLYLFMFFLLFVDKLKQIKFLGFLEVFKHPMHYISSLGIISFFISMILAAVSIFEIKKICVLCVFTYLLNLLIALIAKQENGIDDFKVSFNDFIDAIKIQKYLITFLCISIFTMTALLLIQTSYIFTPQVKRYKELQKYVKMQKNNPFRTTGNILGDKNAKLTIYIYTDYQCPMCRTYNVITCRAANELGGFRIVHKNLPLDMECNDKVSTPFHENACTMARYAIAAEKQGRFWDFNSELFEKQPKTEEGVIKLAESMGFNIKEMEKDADSEETETRLKSEIDSANNLKIDGTPTIVINGKIYTGIKPYYELKDILIKAGAFERE